MTTAVLAGVDVEVNDEGFLVNSDDWTPDVAEAIAAEAGVSRSVAKMPRARAPHPGCGATPSSRASA